jgi:alanine racemase
MGRILIIKDKKAKILGSVCMDMLMVDVTEIDCTEGDAVIIFGEKPTVPTSPKTNTIPYEVLTSISQRVKRVFIVDNYTLTRFCALSFFNII